jgi:hypothetical protein
MKERTNLWHQYTILSHFSADFRILFSLNEKPQTALGSGNAVESAVPADNRVFEPGAPGSPLSWHGQSSGRGFV